MSLLRDLTDEEARRALVLKWGTTPPDVIPAWVAEMDYAVAEPVLDAVLQAVRDGVTGYPVAHDHRELGTAYADWARRHHGWAPDPAAIVPVCDVTAGVRVALDVLSEPGAVVYPVPGYDAQFGLPEMTGRETVLLPVDDADGTARLDLERLDALLAAGARTLMLTQPHNPWGRVFTRAELEGVRDVVVRHGARVVSDEIHAPLALPGAEHVSYLSLEGTHDHAVAVVAASKAFNTAGLRCAQLVVPSPQDRARLRAEPPARNDSWSPLGVVAAVAAYAEGDAWLAALVERLDAQRTLLADLLADRLPGVRMRRPEASYLAWLDVRELGHPDPADLALDRGRVRLSPGRAYLPGSTGFARLNYATSPERLTEIVRRLAHAWT